MRIPLFRVHVPPGVEARIGETLASGRIAQGARVLEFEARLAEFLGAEHVCAASEASAALTLALYLAGVRPGDEVIVSPMSCLATAMPIANLFARPAWCDIDPATGMLDAACAAPLIGERTKAIIAYHWSGNVADLADLRALARAHGIKLVADASEAFGAEIGGRRLGGQETDFSVHSFSAVRHVTTGEGAAIVVDDPVEFERLRRIRRYGIHQASFRLPDGDLNPASDIPEAGFNFAMNDIDAAFGLAQLPHAADIVRRHRENGAFFDSALRGVPGITQLRRRPGSVSAYWTYSLRAERRADLLRKLHALGIGAQRLHLRSDRYACFAGAAAVRRAGTLAGVDAFDADNLSIPCGWWVTQEDREFIAERIREGW